MDGRYSPYVEHHGSPILGWLVFAVLVALLALAVLYVAGRIRQGPQALPALRAAGGDDALSLVRLRYARGEISRDEFLQASEDLGAPPPVPPPPAA